MKKIILAVILLIAAVGAFIFSYQYRNDKISQQTSENSTITDYSSSNNQVSGNSAAEHRLIAEDKKNDYQLYYDGSDVTIVHGEYSKKISAWTEAIKKEIPSIYCKDYDGDGKNELLVKVVSGEQEQQYSDEKIKYVYSLYLFKPIVSGDGEKTFSFITAAANTWKVPFESAIICELTQLKACNKFLQFTMDDFDREIVYDDKTGITKNKHVDYARALTDAKQRYYTLSRWNKGSGIYNIQKDGTITLDIQVLVSYEEIKDVHYIGDIHCQMNIHNNNFVLAPNTIYFKALDAYKTADPRDTAKSKWSCLIHNASTNTNFQSNEIDWIEAKFSLTNMNGSQTMYFETMPSMIKCIDDVKFTQKNVVLTSKKGYTFSSSVADNGKYSVILNKGSKNEQSIAYTYSIKKENGVEKLTIRFDKTYDKEDFSDVLINFGV